VAGGTADADISVTRGICQGWKRWFCFFGFFEKPKKKTRKVDIYVFSDTIFLSVPLLYHSMGQIIKSVFFVKILRSNHTGTVIGSSL